MHSNLSSSIQHLPVLKNHWRTIFKVHLTTQHRERCLVEAPNLFLASKVDSINWYCRLSRLAQKTSGIKPDMGQTPSSWLFNNFLGGFFLFTEKDFVVSWHPKTPHHLQIIIIMIITNLKSTAGDSIRLPWILDSRFYPKAFLAYGKRWYQV